MTSKENIISFPDNLNIKLLGVDIMRLHEHGQAIFVHLSFNEKLSSIQSSFLIKQYRIQLADKIKTKTFKWVYSTTPS